MLVSSMHCWNVYPLLFHWSLISESTLTLALEHHAHIVVSGTGAHTRHHDRLRSSQCCSPGVAAHSDRRPCHYVYAMVLLLTPATIIKNISCIKQHNIIIKCNPYTMHLIVLQALESEYAQHLHMHEENIYAVKDCKCSIVKIVMRSCIF